MDHDPSPRRLDRAAPAAARDMPASTPAPVLALDRETAAATGRGIAYALLAWLLFACMDAGSKLLAEEYSIVQILWVRFVSLLAVSGSLALRHGSTGLITRRFWLQSLRSLMLMVEIGLFIWTITVLPLADAHAILAIAPLLVTALSVPLLGEKVGIRRWTAVGVATIGMLIILRPGFGVMHPMALVALLCACMWSLYQVLTRVVSRTDPPLTTLFYTALIGAVALTVIGPFYWRAPDAQGWALFVVVAVLGASGHYLLIKALQLAPASVLQPFAYTVLVWATIVGYTMFGNLPDRFTVAGALIIVASGLYAFARERRLRRA
jgi:drug/metabolite transporter (DMT)-like permease